MIAALERIAEHAENPEKRTRAQLLDALQSAGRDIMVTAIGGTIGTAGNT